MVLSDVSRALREEERLAWQRLIRVMGHELNNSLAPIKSIAGSLHARLPGTTLSPEEREDFERGLGIIEARAASLNRFLQAYRQLAQMPLACPEKVAPVIIGDARGWAGNSHSGQSDSGRRSERDGGSGSTGADAHQSCTQCHRSGAGRLAAKVQPRLDVSLPRTGSSRVSSSAGRLLEKAVDLTIEDNGPGLLNPSNAFVPFYTTKPSGSGIGLVLSRQIAEAHGGSLELTNRPDERGCRVRVILPRPVG